MTATIQTKKDRPNYYVLIRYRDETAGKERQKWVSTDIPVKGNNKRRAEERRVEVLTDFQQNQQSADLSKDVLFTVFIQEWLENHKQSIDAVTYDTYRLVLHNQVIPFYEPKKLKLKDVTPLHIQQYVKFKLKTASSNTVRKHLMNLSVCFNAAIKQNLITFNPIRGVEMPKNVKYTGAKYYNERQIDELLRVCKGDVLEGILLFALFFGMRRSEIMGLKWDSIDFENRTFTIQHTVVNTSNKLYKKDSTKNKSSYRILPLPDIICSMLKRIKAKQVQDRLLQPNDYINEGYVFTHESGNLIRPNYVTEHFRKLLIKNDLPVIRFHDLRHSAASYLLYLGLDMKDIQMWLGHSDIGTTMNLYAHKGMEAKRNVADILNEKFQRFGA